MTDSGKAPETERRAARLRLGDLLLAAGVLLAAGLLFCVLRACGTTGAEAVVMQDGREILRIRLSGEDADVPCDYGLRQVLYQGSGRHGLGFGGAPARIRYAYIILRPQLWETASSACQAD